VEHSKKKLHIRFPGWFEIDIYGLVPIIGGSAWSLYRVLVYSAADIDEHFPIP
jgi:hypothetical protein